MLLAPTLLSSLSSRICQSLSLLSIVIKYSFSADNTRLYTGEKTSENPGNYVNNVRSCKICSRVLSRPVLYRGLSYQMMMYRDLMPVFLIKIPPALLTRFPESLVPPRSGSFRGKKMSDYIFHLKDLRMRKCRGKSSDSPFSRAAVTSQLGRAEAELAWDRKSMV